MGGFVNVRDMVNAQEDNGCYRHFVWSKTPTVITTIGIWFDLSMSPGNPVPKYWFDATPLNAKQISQSSDSGIWHGSNVTPAFKYLKTTSLQCSVLTGLPMPMVLCDYLLYYPTIDEGTTDTQVMTQTQSLSRYTDGKGVQILAVSVAARTGGQSFIVNYTNSDGVSGRSTPLVIQNSISVNGSIVTSDRAINMAAGPFIPLQSGDTGVRSIESVTMQGIDTGLFTLILVKPLAHTQIIGIDAPVEVDWFVNKKNPTRIYDDAFLNYLCCPQGSLNTIRIIGEMEYVWN